MRMQPVPKGWCYLCSVKRTITIQKHTDMNARLTIGEFSKLCRVTVKALKHYEKMGLLIPSKVDDWTRYRYYTPSQVRRLDHILHMKDMGFSLEEIGDMLDEETHKPSLPQMEEKARQTEEQIQQMQARLTTLEAMAAHQKEMDGMERISVRALPAILVAAHRRLARHGDSLGELCESIILPELQRLGCRMKRPAHCFTVESGANTDASFVDYCVQVDRRGADSPLVRFILLEAVPEAVCVKCHGGYGQLNSHYDEACRYIAQNGYCACGQHRTVFVDGPWNQKDPAKWLTIIQVPVVKDPQASAPGPQSPN